MITSRITSCITSCITSRITYCILFLRHLRRSTVAVVGGLEEGLAAPRSARFGRG
jgi:hypothetical protein